MTPDPVADNSCFHCGLPVPVKASFNAEIAGEPRKFCCLGCESVCKIIYDSGLEGFYQRTPDGQLLAPPPPPPKDSSLYDLDEVQSEYVESLGDTRDIHLLVEGIHCSACVWLIERSLGKIDGIIDIKVNLANKRLHVRWNNQQIKLSEIIQKLGDIGYAAIPFDPETAEGSIKKHNRALLLRMAFAGFTMMNLLWVSIALYSGADKGEFKSLFEWIGFALATPTLLYSGWPFLKGAWSGFKQLHLTMDLPIAIGATTTYAYSVYVTLLQPPLGHVYFDTVVNFIFVILVGRFLEAKSKRHAVNATQRLLDLQPRVATVLRDGKPEIVPVRSIKINEIVIIKAGDKIPVDGHVIDGSSSIDEAMLSGESIPRRKTTGDPVSAGTINIESSLQVRVEAILRNTSLGKIISLVEEAQASKAPIQCIADRIVPWFVSITLLLATFTFIWWYPTDFELALLASTAVLIITCPCAFGLATPMAISVASGLGARAGILVKNGAVLEHLAHVQHYVFDKTGTLTEGKMRVKKIITNNYNEDELLKLAAEVEQFSEHSIARAIISEAKSRSLELQTDTISQFNNKAGYGVKAYINHQAVVIGTHKWLIENEIQPSSRFEDEIISLEDTGISCVHIAIDNREVGIIAIADQLRKDAPQMIKALRDAGNQLTLLSGDRQSVAESIAKELGGMNVIAEVLPNEKDQVIKDIQKRGDTVAMVGDGINDAPALTRADVGIALGSGTDVSMESADIILINDDLLHVLLASQLSNRTLNTIRQNIGISIIYNIIMVPLAMAAFVTPLIAAIAMPISSLAVIANASRIRTLFTNRDDN
ncbi:MAG: heavy metal translocating P-type ATPase [Gammaproteobacteria bacterium]|nr:heavy metal translocating P-type ATPase [Gammaproteobacteria bacterium]